MFICVHLWFLLLTSCAGNPTTPHPGEAWIRANQIGYFRNDPKIAILSSDAPLAGRFSVGDLSADIGPDQGAWGPFAHNYRLDFSALIRPGTYVVRFDKGASHSFVIGDDPYAEVRAALLYFLKLQRCGENPITGRKCHQQDGIDTETGEAVDLVGGWHDAGDSLKHMITTSYCAAALFLAGAEEEARWGAAMVKKLHPKPDTLYVQVGDDRDHEGGWRLWQNDPVDYGWGKGGARAAWRATGTPEGPKFKNASTGVSSLAGRCAAAMALAGDAETAKLLYELAKKHPGCAQSVPVKAPYYYGEKTFYDDLEWGAVELYRATKESRFLEEAARWAKQAGDDSWMARGEHGHYEYFPYVNLAHWRLCAFVIEEAKDRLAACYRNGLEEVRRRAERNPYRLGTPLVWCSTNDVIAFATQARLYESMTGDRRYRELAAEARDWIFGRNPWGVSFVTGVGARAATDVHHPFRALKAQPPTGGLVDGPVSREINRQFEKYFDIKNDPLARFQSEVAVYHDHISDFSTNEPILDGTASLLLLLHLWK